MSELAEQVRAVGLAAGLDAVGIAAAEPFLGTRRDLHARKAAGLHAGMQFTYRNPDRSTDPGRIVPGASSLVVGAKSYLRRQPDPPPSGCWGKVARYAWRDHYQPLREALGEIAGHLHAAGHRAVVVVDDNALVDREAAARAGIGWYGKNANLLLPGRGSWFVLGSVVTDASLVPTAEPVADGCGGCRRCLDGCPTGAIVEPGVVDGRRCLAWLVQAGGVFPAEYRERLGDRLYGCDDCQEVCPPNRAAGHRASLPSAEIDSRHRVDVVALLELSDEDLLAAAGAWYVPQRQPRFLRRNALVVLGNTGDPDDPRVIDGVRRCLVSDDPLVRAHAVWAAARLGLPQLALDRAAVDTDPLVAEELERVRAGLVRPSGVGGRDSGRRRGIGAGS